MPENIRNLSVHDFYRYIGCDILQWGGVTPPCSIVAPESGSGWTANPDGSYIVEDKYRWGTLSSVQKNGRILKHRIESIEDARLLKKIWLNSYCKENDGVQESHDNMVSSIGDDGIYVATLAPSPLQYLIEFEAGLSNFYYLLNDHREEMEELFEIIHKCRLQEYDFFCSNHPAEVIIPIENTSTKLISPSIYGKYSLKHISEYVDIAHKYGKKIIIHMCGHIKDLLPLIKETGLDGIHALTTPSIGDTTYEEALDILGENLIIIGVLDSCIFHKPGVSALEISDFLDTLITPRIKKSNFVLWPVSDGIPTPAENFFAVRDWISRH
ncbi:MAG: uroporphyrinogen decarboxylase family protein [Saccharofermentanales bacterium]